MVPWKHYRTVSRWVARILISKGYEVTTWPRPGKHRNRPHCCKELVWLIGSLKKMHKESEYSVTMGIDEFLNKSIPGAKSGLCFPCRSDP